MPKVIGFIGSRGSGKTCSAVNVLTLDWLIRGEPVWSNVDIDVSVRYRDTKVVYRTHDLNTIDLFTMDNVKGGAVFVDEINMTAAEGTRHMSGANLAFSNAFS